MRCRCQPSWQDGESCSARAANPTPHPDAIVSVVMGLSQPPPVPDDRFAMTERTSSRKLFQWNYPGSMLSSVACSAIKRITAGVKARR